jgi:flagellar biosynthesis protein FlhF
MKTQKIVADSMPQALKMVREELGDNAIIVNTKAIKQGGIFGLFSKQKFEVMAYSVEKGINKAHNQNYYPTQSKLNKAPLSSITTSEKEDKLLNELQKMRKMMMNLMVEGTKPNSTIRFSKWVERLKKQGVEEEVVEFIVNELMKKPAAEMDEVAIRREIISIVEKIIQRRIPQSFTVDREIRRINMIGPTGVGKTTTLAKLATEQVLKQKRKVGMITTDVYRIAAVEQLKTYAGILNVPIEVVHCADELEHALKKLEHCDLIYMDTTGRNYKEIKSREFIHSFLCHPEVSENYLVLSMTTKYEDQKVLLEEFLDSPIQKIVLTKLDETSSFGSALNIAFKYPYRLAYFTNGQSVPEDIIPVDATQLANYLLGEDNENGSGNESARIYASV